MRRKRPIQAAAAVPAVRLCLRHLAAALAAVLVLGAAPARAAELGLVTDLTWGAPAADQEREYRLMGDLGARWVRVSVNWAEVERERGRMNAWSLGQVDAAVRRNLAAGRHVVVMVGEAPQWASGSPYQDTPPRDPAAYGRFVGFLAQRYAGAGVDGYEIWNEENIARFWGRHAPDAAAYVGLLRAGSAAVRRADPAAKVVFGGLSTNDAGYLRAAYAAGAKGLFDVMALHPYTCDPRLDLVRSASFLGYRTVRALMVAHGDPRPMWFTELGWSTTSQACGVSERAQARRLARAVALMDRDRYVRAAMIYSLRDNPWEAGADTREGRFGLMTAGFRAKPAYATFKALAHGGARARVVSLRVRARRGSRRALRVVGRVAGAKAARARVAVELRRHGRARLRRVVRAHRGGRFGVVVRGARRGHYRAVARLVERPHIRLARTFSL